MNAFFAQAKNLLNCKRSKDAAASKGMLDPVVRRLLDSFALIAVIQYVVYRYLHSTMFPFVYTDLYKYFSIVILLIVGGVRFFYLFFHEIKEQENKKSYILKRVFAGCLSLPFLYVGWKPNYRVLVFLPIVALNLYKINSKRVLKWFVATVGLLLLATVICSLTGTVTNLTYYAPHRLVGAYGIINTTDFAAYVTFLLLFFWCLKKDNSWAESIVFILATSMITLVTFQVTDSRTELYCGILTILIMLWECFDEYVRPQKNRLKKIKNGINNLSIIAFPFACVLFIILMVLFINKNPWAIALNHHVLGKRLALTQAVYEQYGIHPFGSLINNMHGNGGTMVPRWTSGYGYIDVAYAMLMLRYGWILFLIVSGLWIWMTAKALKSGDKRIALAMIVLAVHAFTEARFLDINYNIFLVMPFCTFGNRSMREKNSAASLKAQSNSKVFWYKTALTAAFCGLLYLLLPKMLSWLRTIFSLKKWTVGVHSGKALLVSATIIFLMVCLWQSLVFLLEKRKKKAAILSSLVIISFIAAIIAGNFIINQALVSRAESLDQEENVVRLIQSSATQPVYAAEKEELYQRRFAGFSDHIFSTEELHRPPQGTILTDASVEVLGVVRLKGQYTQISPWSGVYSFDPAVIEALTEEGYDWKPYYDGERSCNLADLAVRNSLKLDAAGRLILDGSAHSIISSLEWDQYAGTYAVRYSLEILSRDENVPQDSICTFIVSGEGGDRIILERSVTLADFSQDGECDITVAYEIEDVPLVSFLVTAEDGVQLLVKEIAWQRLS